MTKSDIQAAADRLWEAAERKNVCAPIRDIIGSENLDAAYMIQRLNNRRRKEQGARVVGYKIGLTSKAVQSQLGVDQPDYGLLFSDKEVVLDGEIPMTEVMQPKVETEIAFVLGQDLTNPAMGTAELLSAIDYALVALEVVGSRIADWDIHITDTIADNASASHFVLGHRPVPLKDLDLLNCKMKMSLNGEQVSEGIGAACLGSPINAALWLAKKMAFHKEPLRAGHVLLSGALGPVVSVQAGDRVAATIEGLGEVAVRFS